MVEAADSAVFHASQCKGRAAVRAEFIEQANYAVRIAESDERLAQQAQAQRVTVLFGQL
jgi:hypothetical protein